jgi:hypothetical protein
VVEFVMDVEHFSASHHETIAGLSLHTILL